MQRTALLCALTLCVGFLTCCSEDGWRRCRFPHETVIAETNLLKVRHLGCERVFGEGDTVRLTLRQGKLIVNDSLTVMPAPQTPPRLYPVERLEKIYGDVPYVREALAGASDQRSWNDAVRCYGEALGHLYRSCQQKYDSLCAVLPLEDAAALCATYLETSPLIDSACVSSSGGFCEPSAGPVFTVSKRGHPFREEHWHLRGPGDSRPRARADSCSMTDACSIARQVDMLTVPGRQCTLVIGGGGGSMSCRRGWHQDVK